MDPPCHLAPCFLGNLLLTVQGTVPWSRQACSRPSCGLRAETAESDASPATTLEGLSMTHAHLLKKVLGARQELMSDTGQKTTKNGVSAPVWGHFAAFGDAVPERCPMKKAEMCALEVHPGGREDKLVGPAMSFGPVFPWEPPTHRSGHCSLVSPGLFPTQLWLARRDGRVGYQPRHHPRRPFHDPCSLAEKSFGR